MMNPMKFISIIILACILNFFMKKYVKLSMVFITIFLLILIIGVDSSLFILMFFCEISGKIPIILKIIIIIILILPIMCIKEYISHTVRILDFFINKNKLLKMGYIENGIIKEIKSYGFDRFGTDGQYLIVDLNGEKIKSMPFRYHQGGTMTKFTYKTTYNAGKFHKEKIGAVLEDIPQVYNVGDRIDVVIYNNKKYIKLKEYEINKFL